MFDIANRTALVTGGASGIGLAIVCRFLKSGARVVVADLNNNADLEELNVLQIKTDVGDAESVRRAFDKAAQEVGKLDIVVNNAGVAPETGRLSETNLAAARQTLDVNLNGVMYGLTYAPHCMKDHGSIINTASASAGKGFPTYGPYAASKAAVVGLTRVAAIELGPRGIRVNAVCPGTIATPMEPEDGVEARLFSVLSPLGRIGGTEDVAGLYHFLAADESSFITGQAIYADGGVMAGFSDAIAQQVLGESVV